jgi:hypothetical protein
MDAITHLFYDIYSLTPTAAPAAVKVAWIYAAACTSQAMTTVDCKGLCTKRLSACRLMALPRGSTPFYKLKRKRGKTVIKKQPWLCQILQSRLGVRFWSQDVAVRWAVHNNLVSVCHFLRELIPGFQFPVQYMLGYAVKHGYLSLCHFLKDSGLILWMDMKYKVCNAALRDAARHGHLHICQLLKEWGFPLSKVYATTTFKLVIKNNHLEVCRFLLEWGLTQKETWCGSNMLGSAASRGCVAMGQLLKGWFETKPDRVCTDGMLWGAFSRALKHGHMPFCHFLKEWSHTSADGTMWRITPTDAQCNEVLKKAASQGRLDVLHFFKQWADEGSAVPDNAWWPGTVLKTPKIIWCRNVKELQTAKHAPKPNRLDFNGVLEAAASEGHLHICEFLLQDWRGFNLDSDRQALQAAARKGHLHICQFLRRWRLKKGEGGVLYQSIHDAILDNTLEAARTAHWYNKEHIFVFLTQWIRECE